MMQVALFFVSHGLDDEFYLSFFFGVHFLTIEDHVEAGRLSSDHNIDRRWDAAVKRPFSAFGSKGVMSG